MTWQPQADYLESEVLSADPVRLTEILYDIAVRAAENALECCRNGDIAGRTRHVNKTFEALVELMNSLDFEAGGEIARNYGRLYDYCQRRLLQAHSEQSEPIFLEVQSLLVDLKEAWQTVVANCKASCVSQTEGSLQNLAEVTSRIDCLG
jgi:flagellar secretion chaperone FliS